MSRSLSNITENKTPAILTIRLIKSNYMQVDLQKNSIISRIRVQYKKNKFTLGEPECQSAPRELNLSIRGTSSQSKLRKDFLYKHCFCIYSQGMRTKDFKQRYISRELHSDVLHSQIDQIYQSQTDCLSDTEIYLSETMTFCDK